MAITTLNTTDSGATSRTTINDNFTDVTSSLALKANLASPTFTGTVTLPVGLTGTLKATAGVVSIDSTLTPFSIETTTGVTHSLTTTAGQKVVVWAKGWGFGMAGTRNVTINYNAVQKDIVAIEGSDDVPFALMYTETPGAGTQDITVSASGGSISNVVIIIMKIG
jgi:hypothetical protein